MFECMLCKGVTRHSLADFEVIRHFIEEHKEKLVYNDNWQALIKHLRTYLVEVER